MKKSAAVTEGLAVSDRRLDELAWLLEGSSMCVATAVAGNRFYLAANEFSVRTQSVGKNKKLETICEVMEYLSAIAKGRLSSVEERSRMRDELMKKIIKQQISTSTLGRINIPDGIFDEIITSEVLHSEKLPREFKEKDMAYIALGYGLLVNNRIRKLEASIESALRGDFSGISAEQLEAFKAFSHDDSNRSGSNILFLEPKTGVHAEMQILSEILKMVEKEAREARKEPREFYIGISKRCCLDCDTMLQAANEVLQRQNISIRYEGAHGAAFSDKWVCPAIFIPAQAALEHAVSKKAKNESESGEEEEEEKTVFSLIYEKYREKIAARQGGAADSYSQRHSVSSSDYSSNPEERLSAFKDRLEGDLGAIKRLGVQDQKLKSMLELGLVLCDVEPFRGLFDEDKLLDIVSEKTQQSWLHDMHSGLVELLLLRQSSKPEVTKEALIEFLTSARFVPKEISECFSPLSLTAGSAPKAKG